ncbi:hypothetical protein [Bradyrhizobium cytisi]|uniref:Uncharacterized protein n=1 Tax=Bradyrhizobium cytisi TaxID=515489 RepID=A0A5S4W233_9BRAD|nr:hypothetical protein [Bradyrhizobium cytisi]TYL72554.1 hypothetical protein FXB38_38460 [Bradyrhizobium cytisi]
MARAKDGIDLRKVRGEPDLAERRRSVLAPITEHFLDELQNVQSASRCTAAVELGIVFPETVRVEKIMGVKSAAVLSY